MGDALTPTMLRGFCLELTKIATGEQRVLQGLHEFAGRVGSPLKGLKKGWELMSPTNMLRTSGTAAKGLQEAVINTAGAEARKGGEMSRLLDPLRRTFGAGTHLAPGHVPTGTAEHLSRAGWTGQSRATKYLPIGERSQVALGGAAVAHGVANATKNPETNRGPAEEGLGGLATLGTGTMLFGAPGGMVLPLMAGYGGSLLGRKIDRLHRKDQTT